MQKTNLIALAALSLALTAPLLPAFAQSAPPPTTAPAHGHRGGRLAKLADELALTDAQKTQLKPILQDARQQAKAIKDDTTLTPDARKAKMKDLQKSTRSQMLSILTPEQRAKLKSINQAKRQAKENAGA